jgi:hypothetical protein
MQPMPYIVSHAGRTISAFPDRQRELTDPSFPRKEHTKRAPGWERSSGLSKRRMESSNSL